MNPILLCAALFAAASPSFADIVLLRNGGRLEGSTSREGERLVVRLETGTVKIPIGDVLSITSAKAPADEYAARAAALQKEDAKGHLDLANWCREARLPACERKELEFVLAADPENADARDRLGYEKVEGKWLRGEELLKAKGLVKVDGKWVTAAEAKRIAEEKVRLLAARREMEEKVRAALEARATAAEQVETWVLMTSPAPQARRYNPYRYGGYDYGYYYWYYYGAPYLKSAPRGAGAHRPNPDHRNRQEPKSPKPNEFPHRR